MEPSDLEERVSRAILQHLQEIHDAKVRSMDPALLHDSLHHIAAVGKIDDHDVNDWFTSEDQDRRIATQRRELRKFKADLKAGRI